jgi:hypothetical protein
MKDGEGVTADGQLRRRLSCVSGEGQAAMPCGPKVKLCTGSACEVYPGGKWTLEAESGTYL